MVCVVMIDRYGHGYVMIMVVTMKHASITTIINSYVFVAVIGRYHNYL